MKILIEESVVRQALEALQNCLKEGEVTLEQYDAKRNLMTALDAAEGAEDQLATVMKQRDMLATKVTAWEEKFHAWMATPEAAQRLDGYRSLAQQLNAALMERDELVAALEAVQHVANESTGIVGWHRNGDIATWDELLPEVDAALAKVGADKTGEV